jgi:hypothetical protein
VYLQELAAGKNVVHLRCSKKKVTRQSWLALRKWQSNLSHLLHAHFAFPNKADCSSNAPKDSLCHASIHAAKHYLCPSTCLYGDCLAMVDPLVVSDRRIAFNSKCIDGQTPMHLLDNLLRPSYNRSDDSYGMVNVTLGHSQSAPMCIQAASLLHGCTLSHSRFSTL